MNVPNHKDKYIYFYDCLNHSSDWGYMVDKVIPNNERIVKNIFDPGLKKEVRNIFYLKKYLNFLSIKRLDTSYYNKYICINNISDFIENYNKYLKYKLLFYLKCIKLYINYSLKKNPKDIEFYEKFKTFYLTKYDFSDLFLDERYFQLELLCERL